jgi:hypothetical protein
MLPIPTAFFARPRYVIIRGVFPRGTIFSTVAGIFTVRPTLSVIVLGPAGALTAVVAAGDAEDAGAEEVEAEAEGEAAVEAEGAADAEGPDELLPAQPAKTETVRARIRIRIPNFFIAV